MVFSIGLESGVPVEWNKPVYDKSLLLVQVSPPPAKGPKAHDHVPARIKNLKIFKTGRFHANAKQDSILAGFMTNAYQGSSK